MLFASSRRLGQDDDTEHATTPPTVEVARSMPRRSTPRWPPQSSPRDEDDTSPELIFTKPALWMLMPPRSVSQRSTPRWPPQSSPRDEDDASPDLIFTKPAPQRTTKRSSSPPVVHLVRTVRPRRWHRARHDAAHRRGHRGRCHRGRRHGGRPPLITARRGRRVSGAHLHQARAMDADATEADAPEVDATKAAPCSSPLDGGRHGDRHHHSRPLYHEGAAEDDDMEHATKSLSSMSSSRPHGSRRHGGPRDVIPFVTVTPCSSTAPRASSLLTSTSS